MILWDFAIKKHRSGIKSMKPPQQYKFAACCICESILQLLRSEQNLIGETMINNLKTSIKLTSLVADELNIATEIKVEENLLSNLSDFIEATDDFPAQIPGLYDISMALLTFVESIKDCSIEDNVTEIASYAYQAILDEQIMFDLPKRTIADSELVHLEEQNLVCSQIITSQIDWYKKIENNESIPPMFESLRLLD
jgi:hypothetical protein